MFELNKFAAGVLLAGIIALVAGFFTNAIYKPVTKLEKRGFEVAVVETGDKSEVGIAPKELPSIAELLKTANAGAGEKAAKKCASCHTFDKGGANKVGPNLWNIVNAKTSHIDGFNYSDAMKSMNSKWDYDTLYKFINNPKSVVKGTKMSFAGVSKPEEIADIILYLRSLNDNPPPLP